MIYSHPSLSFGSVTANEWDYWQEWKEAKSCGSQSCPHLFPVKNLYGQNSREEKRKRRGGAFKCPTEIGSVFCVSAVHWHTCVSRTSDPGHKSYNQWLDTATFPPQLCPKAWRVQDGLGRSLSTLLGYLFLTVPVGILDSFFSH